jgi:hypothetical protein
MRIKIRKLAIVTVRIKSKGGSGLRAPGSGLREPEPRGKIRLLVNLI